ncbi:MAG: hypothetical protein QW514_07870 [Thermoprotei archaeon]
MGRTNPSFRSVLDFYVERLRRLVGRVGDEELRGCLLELLEHAHDLENEFALGVGSPEEEVFLSLILYVFREARRVGGGAKPSDNTNRAWVDRLL